MVRWRKAFLENLGRYFGYRMPDKGCHGKPLWWKLADKIKGWVGNFPIGSNGGLGRRMDRYSHHIDIPDGIKVRKKGWSIMNERCGVDKPGS